MLFFSIARSINFLKAKFTKYFHLVTLNKQPTVIIDYFIKRHITIFLHNSLLLVLTQSKLHLECCPSFACHPEHVRCEGSHKSQSPGQQCPGLFIFNVGNTDKQRTSFFQITLRTSLPLVPAQPAHSLPLLVFAHQDEHKE